MDSSPVDEQRLVDLERGDDSRLGAQSLNIPC